MNSVIGYWLKMSKLDLRRQRMLAQYILHVLRCCYSIREQRGNFVRNPSFAEKLLPEHRELHYELATGYPGKGRMTLENHHKYHALWYRQVKRGEFKPQPYPTDRFPGSLADYPDLTMASGKDSDSTWSKGESMRVEVTEVEIASDS
ncbi:hypothetical protein GE09DRAFT_111130 [Coniochaeta sp. 2T2.1]|nr:hypothetical protein GE09DRAFT_111130 [Coniochaeta sp. 2T2.1]